MYKSVLSIWSGLILSLAGFSQDFQTVFTSSDVDFLVTGAQLPNDQYVLAGHTTGAGEGSSDALLVKTDEYGEMLWSKTYGSAGSDSFRIIRSLPDGTSIVAGNTQSVDPAGLPKGFYSLLSEEGDVIWCRYIDGGIDDQIRDIRVLPQGGFVATGFTNSFSPENDYDLFITRLNTNGETVWSRAYGSDAYEVPLSVMAHSDGSFYIWGHQLGENTDQYDTILLKIDLNGNLVWQRRFGLELNELAWDILETPEGDILLSGDSNSEAMFGLNDTFLIRLNTEGEIIWSRHYGGEGHDHGTRLVHVENDAFVLGGATSTFGNGGLDFLMMQFDGDGNVKQTKATGGEIKDVIHGLISTNDDGILAIGETRSFGQGYYSGMAVKIDQNGEDACSTVFNADFQSEPIEFTVGSPGVELRAEELESIASDFLTVSFTDGLISEETVCTEAPPGGNLEHSEITEAHNDRHNQLRLVPNPSPGNVTAIIRTQHEVVSDLTVFNLGGQIVFQQSIMGTNGHRNLQLNRLPTGIYLARLTTGERVETKKLIVE